MDRTSGTTTTNAAHRQPKRRNYRLIPCALDSLLAQCVDWSFADELPPRDPNDNDESRAIRQQARP
jgi:hypothetical protein